MWLIAYLDFKDRHDCAMHSPSAFLAWVCRLLPYILFNLIHLFKKYIYAAPTDQVSLLVCHFPGYSLLYVLLLILCSEPDIFSAPVAASLLIITKTTLLLSAFVFLAALHVDKISAPMKKLTHTAHVLLANLEVFLSDLSARSNIPGIRTYLDEYVDALLASLERQEQADTVGSVLGDKFSSTDDPPKSKQLVPIRTSTHICLDSPGDVQVRNVLKRRLDAMYLEFDEEGWLLLPSAGSDPKQENLKHLHGVPVVPISHRL